MSTITLRQLLDLTGSESAREWANAVLDVQRLHPLNRGKQKITLTPEQLAQLLDEFLEARVKVMEEKARRLNAADQHFATVPLSHEHGRDILSPDVPIRYEEAALAREALIQYAKEIEDLGGTGVVFRTVAERINLSMRRAVMYLPETAKLFHQ